MDPELKKQLDALRAEIGKNVEALARIDRVEAAAVAGEASLKELRKELDLIRSENTEREKTIRELKAAGRVQAVRVDPIVARREAQTMLGMIVRQELARQNRMELPEMFRAETELVRAYQQERLARATLTPMSTTGSYAVPTVTDASIQDSLEEVSELLSLVDFIPNLPAGGTFNFTFLATRPVMQKKRSSTDTAMTASDPVFAQLQLSPAETYVFFPVDNKMFLMSAMALGGYFEGLCRDAMADKLAYWLLRADGSTDYNSITGVLKDTTADYITYLPAGKKSFGDLTGLDLNRAKAACYKRARGPRGRWIMDLEIQGIIEAIKVEDAAPIITYAQDGTPRVKQNPVVIEEYMPGLDEDAPDTALALFGDPATLLVGMVGGMQIASDASVRFDKNQTAFRGTTIVDIKRKPVKTLTLVKTAKT